MRIISDLKEALKCKETFWLNLSIFIYTATLPFNAIGFKIFPGEYFKLKITKIALLPVIIFGIQWYRHNKPGLVKAPFLYSFLALQATANFLSIINSPDKWNSFLLAVTISLYSGYVFILVNTIRTEALRKAIFSIMAMVIMVVIIHSITLYVMNGGYFNARIQPSIIGYRMPDYLSYILLMFGAGVVYLYLNETQRWPGIFLFILVTLWLFAIILPSMKIFQIAAFLFLSLLIVTFNKKWKRVLLILTIYITLFFIQFNIVRIINAASLVKHTIVSPITESISQTKVKHTSVEKNIKGQEQQIVVSPITESISQVKNVEAKVEEREDVSMPSLIEYSSDENFLQKRWLGKTGRDSLELRIRGIAIGWFMGYSHIWTGVGVGQTKYSIDHFSNMLIQKANDPSYFSKLPLRNLVFSNRVWGSEVDGLYNIFANAWAETGIFGFIAIVGILLTVTVKGIHALRRFKKEETRESLRIFLPLFIAFIVIHQAQYFWANPWLWTIIALTYASADITSLNQEKRR